MHGNSRRAITAATATILTLTLTACLSDGSGTTQPPGGQASGTQPQSSGTEAQLKDAYQNVTTFKLEPGNCYRMSGGNSSEGIGDDPEDADLCFTDGKLTATKETLLSKDFLAKLPLKKDCANTVPEGSGPGGPPPNTEPGLVAEFGGFLCLADETGSSVFYAQKPDDRGVVTFHVSAVTVRGPLGG